MVGAAEGAGVHQRVGGVGHARHGVDLRGLQRLCAGHVRQDGGQPPRQHGLARAGGAHQQDVVAAGSGDLQRPLHVLLPHDVGKVRQGTALPSRLPAGLRGHGFLSAEMCQQLRHVLHGVDLHAVGQGRLRRVVGGHEQLADAQPGGGQRHGQHARHRAQRAAETQLAQKGRVLRQRAYLLRRRQNAQQDGQVVHRALLAHTRRSQIHGDAADGELLPAVLHRRPDALAGFLHRRVRQTHHVEGRQSAGDNALHRHLVARDARQTQRPHRDHHGTAPFTLIL